MDDTSELFNDSYARVSADDVRFFDTFYEVFIGKSKDVAALFANVDMARQKRMLQKSMAYMVTYAGTRTSVDVLGDIARIHHERVKVPRELYALWLESLIETLARVDPQFDEHVERAWRTIMGPGVAFMRDYETR